jgi:hypothetical protein
LAKSGKKADASTSKKKTTKSSASSKKKTRGKKPPSRKKATAVSIRCDPTGIACKVGNQSGYYVYCKDLGHVCIPNIKPDQDVKVVDITAKNDGISLETIRASFSYEVHDSNTDTWSRGGSLTRHQAIKTTPANWNFRPQN